MSVDVDWHVGSDDDHIFGVGVSRVFVGLVFGFWVWGVLFFFSFFSVLYALLLLMCARVLGCIP